MEWIRKNGERIDVQNMNDSHLYNAIKLTRRNVDAKVAMWFVGPFKHCVIPAEALKGLTAEAKRREELKKKIPSTGRQGLTIAQLTELGAHFFQKQIRKLHGCDCECVEKAYEQMEFNWEDGVNKEWANNPKTKEFVEKIRAQAKEEERAEVLELIVSKLLDR